MQTEPQVDVFLPVLEETRCGAQNGASLGEQKPFGEDKFQAEV